jgi:hypothetical protein
MVLISPWNFVHALLRLLDAGLLSRKSGFDPSPVGTGFIVDSVAMGHVSVRVLQFLSIRIILLVTHAFPFIYYRHYIIDSIVKLKINWIRRRVTYMICYQPITVLSSSLPLRSMLPVLNLGSILNIINTDARLSTVKPH